MTIDTALRMTYGKWLNRLWASAVFLAVVLLSPMGALGQATVSMTDIVAAVNDEVWVSIVLAGGDPGTSVGSFQMSVTPSDPAVQLLAVSGSVFHDRVGTLSAGCSTVASNVANGNIGAFGCSFVAVGTLVKFKLKPTAAGNYTVDLAGFKLSRNPDAATVAHTPSTPSLNLIVTDAGNRPPVGVDDSYSIGEGGTLTVPIATGVLANDTDADGQPLTAVFGSGVAHGTLTFNSDGSFVYVHDGGESTSDSFTYAASDGALTDGASVAITINPVNDPPVVADVTTSARNTVPKAVALSATDPDDSVFSFSVVSGPTHGTVSIAGSTATYTGDAGYIGADSFTYLANDGDVDSAPATVSITVTGNTPPVGSADSYSVNEGATVTITAANGVLANDSDVDGDPLTVTLKNDVANGSLNFAANGGFTYVHNGSETLSDSFTYTLSDGAASVDVVVTLTINPVNDPPVAVGGSATTSQGVPVEIPLMASDPEGSPLTFVVALPGIFGEVTITGSTATYDPNPGFSGTDEFAFMASDGTDNSNVATVTVTVLGVARVQFVHNVAEALLDPADVYVDGVKELDDARFRDATGFMEMAAGRHTIAIAPGASTSVGTAIGSEELDFADGGTYTVVATGTIASGIDILALPDARETGTSGSTLDIRVFNGTPDVASLDVRWMADTKDHGLLDIFVAGLAYGSATTYMGRVPRGFNLEARPSSGVAIDTYRFDWTGREGDAVTLMSSGSTTRGGAYAFTLMAVGGDGSVDLPAVVTSVASDDLTPRTFLLRGNFPNPFNPTTMVQFDLPEAAEVSIRMTDLLGRVALSTPPQPMDAGANQSIMIDGADLASGIYIYRVTARAAKTMYTAAGTMTLLK